jgi:hypothetical protein
MEQKDVWPHQPTQLWILLKILQDCHSIQKINIKTNKILAQLEENQMTSLQLTKKIITLGKNQWILIEIISNLKNQ